jgi:hypothetical protein
VGDPGLGGFLKGVAKTAIGFVTGGPQGAATAAISSLRGRGAVTPAIAPRSPGFAGPQLPVPVMRQPGFGGALARAIPGGSTGLVVQGSPQLGCPSGYHPNKSAYFLRDGTFVPAGSRCVKNRRRDPLNPKALRRSIERVNAGKVWQSKLRDIETGKYTKAGARKDK